MFFVPIYNFKVPLEGVIRIISIDRFQSPGKTLHTIKHYNQKVGIFKGLFRRKS